MSYDAQEMTWWEYRDRETSESVKVFLVSAMVEKPGVCGHRAYAGAHRTKEEALGYALLQLQTNGFSVTSWDVSECTTLVPKDKI